MTAARVVVVTGCSRGLGLAICREVAQAGYRVVGVSRTESDGFRELVDARPGQLSFMPLDLGVPADVHEFARELIDREGAPYALVNNAAVGGDGVLATLHERDVESIVNTNLVSPMLLTKYLCRPMLSKREGRIVNVSSIVARTGYSGLSVYGATKAGIEGFTKSLSRELGKRGITVNNVAPGYMETQMTSGLGEAGLESVRRRAPLDLPTPDDVAPAVVYLLSEAAAKVTGTTLTVDGGATA